MKRKSKRLMASCTLCDTTKRVAHLYTMNENLEMVCGTCGYKP